MHETGELGASTGPVMTFQAAGAWLGVRIDQMDRVAFASELSPVPLTCPEYAGLLDDGEELIPVLSLHPAGSAAKDQLVAILHVRGEPVGLAIERAGRMYNRFHLDETASAKAAEIAPAPLRHAHPRLGRTSDTDFWLIDADLLWQQPQSALV